jgi:hypothetical protein
VKQKTMSLNLQEMQAKTPQTPPSPRTPFPSPRRNPTKARNACLASVDFESMLPFNFEYELDKMDGLVPPVEKLLPNLPAVPNAPKRAPRRAGTPPPFMSRSRKQELSPIRRELAYSSSDDDEANEA